jgi:hypothetical protein
MMQFHLPTKTGKNRLAGIAAASAAGFFGLLAALSPAVLAQNPSDTPNNTANRSATAPATELEPQALNALRAMSNQLRALHSFSFTARIDREEPGTNGQMLDFFRQINVQLERPNQLRMDVKSDSSDTTLWYDGKTVTLMPAGGKIYTTLPAPGSIGATLMMLHDKLSTHMPLRPILSEDPYGFMSEGLESAHVIGIVNAPTERLLHLAFTEPDADWQLWLTGPTQILPHRMAIIYKQVEGQPRETLEFTNWQLNPPISSQTFRFVKPQGAVEENLNAVLPKAAGQTGGKAQ